MKQDEKCECFYHEAGEVSKEAFDNLDCDPTRVVIGADLGFEDNWLSFLLRPIIQIAEELCAEPDQTLSPGEEVTGPDMINHPSHYTHGKVETIDCIESSMNQVEFIGYLKGNVIKYLSREGHKGGIEDLRKARWYLNLLIDTIEESK